MTEEQIKQKAEEYVMREDVITENDRVPFDNGYGFQTVSFEDEVKQAFIDGYHEGFKDCAKSRLNVTTISDCPIKDEWHDINDIEPSKEQFGKPLLIRMESVTGDTDYDYLVYKHKGESISDVAGVLAWKEIE